MKVTVCFDDIRIVVPCGSGQLTVAELTELAVKRYKKAVSQSQDVLVTVHNLKSSDGGILDVDDKVADVVDDKEQITANFDVSCRLLHQNNGDGTSASSVGTSSPDGFHPGRDFQSDFQDWQKLEDFKDTIITHSDLKIDSPLKVRRVSDPLMANAEANTIPKRPVGSNFDPSLTKSLRNKQISSQPGTDANKISSVNEECSPADSFNDSAFRAFMRTASRKSLNNGTAMMQWLEAQERVQDGYMRNSREEPIGSSDEAEVNEYKTEPDNSESFAGALVEIENPGGPLGVHVIPFLDENGRNLGLEITEIESGSFVEKDRRLQLHDCICEINGAGLMDVDYARAQEVFRDALKHPKLSLRIHSPYQRVSSSPLPTDIGMESISHGNREDPENSYKTSCDGKSSTLEKHVTGTLVIEKEKVPPAPSPRHVTATSSNKTKFAPISSTRIIGQRIEISLKKGQQGLGFSITTRDNPAGSECPIYIKNILPEGAAILDGRLRSGDRLLEINGIQMSGKSQTEVVTLLRSLKVGGTVHLVISRQMDDQLAETDDPLADEQLDQTRPAIATDHVLKESQLIRDSQILKVNGETTVRISNEETALDKKGLTIKGGTNEQSKRHVEMPPPSTKHRTDTSHVDPQNTKLGRYKNTSDPGFTNGKLWRNISYQMATNDDDTFSEVNAGDKNNEKYKQQFNYKTSDIKDCPLSHVSSLTKSDVDESKKRMSNSSECSSQNQPSLFSRDGLGRRSMSEKRRAFADPRASVFYQKMKEGKGQPDDMALKRTGSVESLMSQTGTTSKLNDIRFGQILSDVDTKRSRSMKNLEDIDKMSPNNAYSSHPLPLAATKSRKWNESFQAAIDRSYYVDPALIVSSGVRDSVSVRGIDPGSFVSQVDQCSRHPGTGIPQFPTFEPKRVVHAGNGHFYQQQSIPNRWQQKSSREDCWIDQRDYQTRNNQHPAPIGNGYHGYMDAKPPVKMKDTYASVNYINQIIPDPRSNVYDHYSSRSSPQTNKYTQQQHRHSAWPSNVQPQLNSYSDDSMSRTNRNARSDNRNGASAQPGKVFQHNNFDERTANRGHSVTKHRDDGQTSNFAMTCDSFPNLVSHPNAYLNDLTNMTKSSRDLSSYSGFPRGMESHQPEFGTRTDFRMDVPIGTGSLNSKKSEMQRRNGFLISSGALV